METQKYINDIAYKIVGCARIVNKFLFENITQHLVPIVTEQFAKLSKE